MSKRLLIIAICYFILGGTSAYGGEIKFERVAQLGVQISGIVQDREGFFWIGTSHGLMRYDGIAMKTWRKDEDSLSEDFIRAIYDTEEAIWILTNTQGLNRFDKTTGVFKHYKHDPDNENSLRGAGGFALLVDVDGFVWVGTENGVLTRLDPQTDTFIHFKHDPKDPNSIPKGFLTSIYQDSSGAFWIGSEGGGLTKLEFETRTFTNYTNIPGDPHSISGNRVNVILEDEQDILWVGTAKSGLNKFNKKTGRFEHFRHASDDPSSISHNSVMSLCLDTDPYLWVGTIHGGLNRLNKKTGDFERFLNDPSAPDANSTKVIEEIFIDRSNILWILSRPGAILKHDRKSKGFALYQHDPAQPGSISSNTILPIYEDRQGVAWIGTGNGGLNRYNRESDTFVAYKHDPKDPDSLPAPGVFAIAEDEQGTFWVAASDASQGTLCIFDRQTKRVVKTYTHDPNNPNSIINNRFLLGIQPDRFNPNILWLTVGFGGLVKFDTQTELFEHYPIDPDDPKKLAGNYLHIFQDDSGTLWLGGSYGLDKLDPATGVVSRYRHEANNPNSLIEDNVSAIYADRSGILWLGTGGGLDRFDPKTDTFTHYSSKNGLPDNNIMGVFEDEHHNLWMSSGGGIIKFNPQAETFKLYTRADGLQGDKFYYFAHCKTGNGEIWFGGFNGVNRFHPDNIKNNPHLPTIVLTSLKQGGEEIFFGKMPPKLKEIELDWRTNFIEFEAAALEFTNPEKNRFMYMLAGIDETWYPSGTRRYGRYTHLPGGKYYLKIKGSNNDGIWNEDGVSLKIRVAHPPWRTWWAICLYIVFAAALLLFFVRYQQVKLEQERKTNLGLKRINRLKDEILANTSHELRTPLNGIIGLSESLLDGIAGQLPAQVRYNLKMIVSSGLRMVHLVNDILDFSKLSKKELKPRLRPVDIKILVDIVIEISKPLTKGKDLQLLNQIPINLPSVYADEDMVQQILHNLVGNAIKFTDKGSITISTSFENEDIIIHVKDTGIGIQSDQLDSLFEPFEQVDGSTERAFGGTGLGLAISKNLVSLLGGSMGVDSQIGRGSQFWFSLPTAPEELAEKPPAEPISRTRLARLADAWIDTESQDVPESQPDTKLSPDRPYRVLVVDDDPINLHVLVNQLTLKNYVISQASDGETALAMVEQAGKDEQQFDLILLDVMMPKMSGYEVCKQLRITYPQDKLPVVMLTAKNQVDDLIAGFESGANDYLPKPFSKEELFARIENQIIIKDLAQKRRQAEQALQASNEKLSRTGQYFEMVIDNANVWMNVIDSDGNVKIWNKAAEEISGYSRDEVMGNNKIWEWSYPDDTYRKEIEAKATAIINREEEIADFETTIHRKDNKTRTISWHSRSLTDEIGNPIGSIAIGRDITARKQLEEQLAHAQKMEAVGTLASGIAHDFNNLLQAINGYAQILLLEKSADDPEYNQLNLINQAGERAAQLVQQLLLFSRKVVTERKPYGINPEVRKINAILQRTIPKMISIELQLGSDLWPIIADPVQIEQILLNLGTNAADAMPDGGRFVIRTENVVLDQAFVMANPGVEPGNYVLIKASDTGHGISKETVEHIFDPFFTTKDIGKGTGLGLASVYGIVKNHNGHIVCHSVVGEGTSFEIYLPAAENLQATEKEVVDTQELNGGTETVLLVDDEEIIRDFASQILRKVGYHVITAASGEEALKVYLGKHSAIDLIIMDLGMPGMGGYKCLREIMLKDPDAKIVVSSGYAMNDQLQQTLDAGAVGYIGKPYKMNEILNKVRSVLDAA